MYSIMEECASIWYGTKDKKKAGIFSWWVNFFWSIFSWSLKTFCFFLEAWGLFGIFWPEKGRQAFRRPKNPKKAEGLQKKQNVWELKLKILQNKLTNHKSKPAFFLSEVACNIDAHSSMNIIFHIRTSFCRFTHFILSVLWIFIKKWKKISHRMKSKKK